MYDSGEFKRVLGVHVSGITENVILWTLDMVGP